ncbi:P-loop containing nucleoside triphosphate hydrolase protein [Imleria badia]|nr:P-loop containing nucleoside triphosphate hydrolase protein [Imleria badia]
MFLSALDHLFRCQRSGWEKPIVDTRKHGDGWTFVVSLSRINKRTAQKETIRFEPHPPYTRPTALEARHWGATYALYRFCNGMQLNRVLPPGPREYWTELALQHKAAPEHQKWMYDADPFAARKEVEERQAKAAQKKEEKVAGFQGDTLKSSISPEFTRAPEVRMSSALRDLVEDTVKKASVFYPPDETTPLILAEEDVHAVTQQLRQLGFQPIQIQNAISYLSVHSPLGSHLLGSLAPLEACIEYLLLHIAETDLPRRFLPSNNSSNPFVVSGHSGADNLKKRWIEDLAIKEAGFPPHVVKEYTADPNLAADLVLVLSALSGRLIGKDSAELFKASSDLESSCRELRSRTDEVEALGAHFVDPCHIVMPLFSAPVELHVILPPDTSNDRSLPAVYIGSHSVPPYVRLHLLAQLLCAAEREDFIEPGEGFLIAAMRVLEDHWAEIETNGPPEMSTIVGHLIIPRTVPRVPDVPDAGPIDKENRRTMRRKSRYTYDDRSDEQVKQDFENVRQTRIYAEMLASRQRLPAFSAKDQFLDILETHRAVVVVGETGCGKTTQLPQFIVDTLIQSGHGSKASIIVTQPRRISAISVAARVSAERADDGSVGYAIRGEAKQDKRTKLLFCTTGVLLRRLGSGDKLENVTHVVVDEVHERSVDGDFLLLELRELLLRRDTLKVVLMSATINHDIFVKYFDNAPLLTIPGFTHPVEDRYLEDFIDLLHYVPPGSKRGAKGQNDKEYEDRLRSQGLSEQGVSSIRNIAAADRIDYQLISMLIKYITSSPDNPAGILIFLPGVEEIRQCIAAISSVVVEDEVVIYPLHANLTSEEQRAIFKVSKKWKIIAATNVAETSITIDDVIYVIDGGKVKETNYNPDTGLSILTEQWITRAAARQRRGRAGRTKPGICYKLYTRKQEENMSPFPVPEILRIPLESVSLIVKVMRENEDVRHFLKKAIDPPDVSAMDKAWTTLQELGAVDKESKLTALGRHMAMLPLDLRLGKMLVLGLILRCLNPVLTIVASLSSKPLFASPLEKREAATQARLRFDKHNSDLLTDVHAYNECIRLRSDESRGTLRRFCEEASATLLYQEKNKLILLQNFISTSAIHEITSLRQDFFSSLLNMGLTAISSTPNSPSLNVNSTNTNLIKAVILGGLWPRVARVHLPPSAIKFDKVQAGTVQRENTAKEYKMYDLKNGRVFLHPASVLFGESTWKSPFFVYFQMQQTTKVFVRGATEVPMYALLLFGGPVSVNHVGGGLTVGSGDSTVKLRAWPRIGTLVNQLRRLLEAQLQQCIEQGLMLGTEQDSMISSAITALLEQDGLTSY